MQLVLEPRLNAVVRTEWNGELVVLLPGLLTSELVDLARALLTGDELRQLVEAAERDDLLYCLAGPVLPPREQDRLELTETV